MTAIKSESVSARKYRWHQSTLSSLLDGCSWQYFLTYIIGLDTGLKPHAEVGTAFHSAIELHELNRKNGVETSQQEMQEYAEKEIKKAVGDTELLPELLGNLRGALANWYECHRPTVLGWEVVAIEPEFTLPLVDNARPIGGYIDAVYRDPATNNLFIVDWKTAKNFDRWRDGDGHRTQAAMYATALVLSEDFPDITELPEMVYMVARTATSIRKDFEKGRVIRVQPTIEDVRLLGDRIRAAELAVETEDYKPKPEWPLCSVKWCAFYEKCQVTKELSGTPVLIRERVQQQFKQEQSNVSATQGHGNTQYNVMTNNEEVN
jgi:hypothetical protein